jgi:hypothetical protein
MKKQLTYLSVALLSVGLFFTSCKKEKTTAVDTTIEAQSQSDDQSRFSNESDAADDDANAALENLGGSYAGESPLTPQLPFTCDATVTVDTASNPRTITITYNGNVCLGARTRTGSVVLSFAPGFRWATAGAQYSIAYQNLKITRVIDNKSITINGTKTITNVSGGKLRNLATRLTPIVHTVQSTGMSITFDDASQRTWQVARQRSFSYDNGIVITITGISTQGGGIAEWGVNRHNHTFTSAILQPLVIKQSCNFRLVSGKVQHVGQAVTTTTTFGLDASGNPVTSCPIGPFYYQTIWTGPNGNSLTHIGMY